MHTKCVIHGVLHGVVPEIEVEDFKILANMDTSEQDSNETVSENSHSTIKFIAISRFYNK